MMKQLKISVSLSQYHENPTIYLGHAEWLKHKSQSFLKKYVRTYKKVLLDNVRIINSHNAQIYTLYRTFYFDLSEIDVHNFNQYNNDFNSSFNWMFDNRGGCQNSIIFSKIDSCISTSLKMLYILQKHGQIHKNYSLKNQAESYIKMIENFDEKYSNEKKSLSLERNYEKDNLKIVSESLGVAI